MSSTHRAVFLDRDNTLIANDGDCGDPAAVVLMPGVAEGLARLKRAGFLLVVVTNQGGVARGRYTEDDVAAVHARIGELVDAAGGEDTRGLIDRFYFCPFHPEASVAPYRREHPWRKPQPGMLLQAAQDLELDLPRSWLIGDAPRDIEAGHSAGCRTVLLAGESGPALSGGADAIARDFSEAVEIVLGGVAAKPVHLSVVIPAHDEERELPRTLAALRAALREVGVEHEVVVVDDASTDRTAEIAREHGARVEHVSKRQIAATRNAGAKVTHGEWLLFVDADTRVRAQTLREMLDAMQRGVVGGGALVDFEPPVPLWARVYMAAFNLVWRRFQYSAGCFFFARRADFEAVGGFDEKYFAGEEIWLSRAMRARGAWSIVRTPVLSSGRKARMTGCFGIVKTSLSLLLRGPKAWQQREGLELWYGDVRERDTPT